MTPTDASVSPSRYRHHPREIAAAVTLRAAAAALVADGPRTGWQVAVTTACGAFATRLALIAFVAARGLPDPSGLTAFDPFRDPTPAALHGVGPAPDRARVRLAGDRCVQSWRWCASGLTVSDGARGVAGALALASWCSWALGSEARAMTRARYALDVWADDPLAQLVLRTCRARHVPSWS